MILNSEQNKITPVLSSFISYICTFVFEKTQISLKSTTVNPDKNNEYKKVLDELGLTEDDISEEVFY